MDKALDTLIQTQQNLIDLSEHWDATVAHLVGDINDGLRRRAGEALSRVLDRGLPLVLDLRKVRSIDATGIAFVVQCCTIGRDEGLRVTLLEPPPVIVDVLRLIGLEHTCHERNEYMALST